MTDLYSNDKVREQAERLVQQNVKYCISGLINDLNNTVKSGNMSAAEVLGIQDELCDILSKPDYEAAVDYHIDVTMTVKDLVSYLEDQGEELDEGADETSDKDEIKKMRKRAHELATEQGLQEFCDEFSRHISVDQIEAYEHWLVDDWFADKLAEKGEMVNKDILGLTVWGRATTGQAISMDSVVLEIANDLLKD